MARIGIKALSLFAGAIFAMVVVVGCNPEEPTPSATPTPAAKPGGAAPAPAKTPTPSATPTETKKP